MDLFEQLESRCVSRNHLGCLLGKFPGLLQARERRPAPCFLVMSERTFGGFVQQPAKASSCVAGMRCGSIAAQIVPPPRGRSSPLGAPKFSQFSIEGRDKNQ